MIHAIAIVALLAAQLTTNPLVAQPPTSAAASAPAIDPVRLAALPTFIDGVLAQQLATREVAGAVVTVVYNGQIILNRGYGFADVASDTPIDPQRTLFRPGSVSKLFTWTALMQQVERGKVDLDADVNRYLDYKIPDFEGQPIRVRNLLSHSPGFSDLNLTSLADESKLVPYQRWLKANIPSRQWAPGTEAAYSNYGAALAGYIVERVSGEPFATYVERHIFTPLAMDSTTFREPLPPALRSKVATGYRFTNGRFEPKPFELISSIMPAGSASTSAPDMARFMLALLDGGRLGSARILTPASVALMESNAVANAPHLPAVTHGMLVTRDVGPRLVGHGGNTVDSHSYLLLAPELHFGFFVAFTGGMGSSLARTELTDAIVGRLFPQQPAPRWTGVESPPPLGAYRTNRRDYTQPADPKRDLKVTSAGPHRLTVESDGRTTAWDQIGPRLYEQATGVRAGGPYDRLEFYGTDADPRLSFASQPPVAYHLVKP